MSLNSSLLFLILRSDLFLLSGCFFLLYLLFILTAPSPPATSPHLFEKTKYEGYTCSTVDQVCFRVAG